MDPLFKDFDPEAVAALHTALKGVEHEKENPLIDSLWGMAEETILPMLISKTSLYIQVKFGDVKVKCLLDTGAEDNVIDYSLVKTLGLHEYIDTTHISLIGGVGHNVTVGKIPYTEIEIDGDRYPVCFTVMNIGIRKDCPILGLPFMFYYKTIIDLTSRTLNIMGKHKNLIISEH
jgi:hypothetical protein